MIKRSAWLLTPVLALCFAGPSMGGFSCPEATGLSGPAPLNLGASCGQTVSVTPTSVSINVGPTAPTAAPEALEPWLGLGFGELFQDGIFPLGGAAVQFDNVVANPGDLLQFSWTGSFEPEATGYLFYLLNGAMNVLDSQVFFGNMTMYNTFDMLSVPQSVSVPLSTGNNTVAFGVVSGLPGKIRICPPEVICELIIPDDIVILDPVLTVTNVAVGPAAVPEPGTIALFGMGLLGLAALRRKRS